MVATAAADFFVLNSDSLLSASCVAARRRSGQVDFPFQPSMTNLGCWRGQRAPIMPQASNFIRFIRGNTMTKWDRWLWSYFYKQGTDSGIHQTLRKEEGRFLRLPTGYYTKFPKPDSWLFYHHQQRMRPYSPIIGRYNSVSPYFTMSIFFERLLISRTAFSMSRRLFMVWLCRKRIPAISKSFRLSLFRKKGSDFITYMFSPDDIYFIRRIEARFSAFSDADIENTVQLSELQLKYVVARHVEDERVRAGLEKSNVSISIASLALFIALLNPLASSFIAKTNYLDGSFVLLESYLEKISDIVTGGDRIIAWLCMVALIFVICFIFIGIFSSLLDRYRRPSRVNFLTNNDDALIVRTEQLHFFLRIAASNIKKKRNNNKSTSFT